MSTKNIAIVRSLLQQVGGPIRYKDLLVDYEDDHKFYDKWNQYVQRVLLQLTTLDHNEKVFLFRITEFIKRKLDWEATTVTGYSDEEIQDAIKELKSELNISPGPQDEHLSEYLPHELSYEVMNKESGGVDS